MATIETELIETKRDERGRQIRTTSERKALVKAYQSSGLTQRAFAEREGIKYTTFVAWVQDAKRAAPKTPAGFTELTLQEDRRRRSRCSWPTARWCVVATPRKSLA